MLIHRAPVQAFPGLTLFYLVKSLIALLNEGLKLFAVHLSREELFNAIFDLLSDDFLLR